MTSYIERVQEGINKNFEDVKKSWKSADFLWGYAISQLTVFVGSKITMVSPWTTISYIHVTYLVDQVVAPFFNVAMSSKANTTGLPFAAQMGHILTSGFIAKKICTLFTGHPITYKVALLAGMLYLTGNYVALKANQHSSKIAAI